MNPINKDRTAQLRIRRILDVYTKELCPVCPNPCCRKPTRVREFDVLLAEACGCSLPSANESVSQFVQAGIDTLTGDYQDETYTEPCDYLGDNGCLFPRDLRPFECTRWMCSYLKETIRPGEMRELRALLHKLGALRREIEDFTK